MKIPRLRIWLVCLLLAPLSLQAQSSNPTVPTTDKNGQSLMSDLAMLQAKIITVTKLWNERIKGSIHAADQLRVVRDHADSLLLSYKAGLRGGMEPSVAPPIQVATASDAEVTRNVTTVTTLATISRYDLPGDYREASVLAMNGLELGATIDQETQELAAHQSALDAGIGQTNYLTGSGTVGAAGSISEGFLAGTGAAYLANRATALGGLPGAPPSMQLPLAFKSAYSGATACSPPAGWNVEAPETERPRQIAALKAQTAVAEANIDKVRQMQGNMRATSSTIRARISLWDSLRTLIALLSS